MANVVYNRHTGYATKYFCFSIESAETNIPEAAIVHQSTKTALTPSPRPPDLNEGINVDKSPRKIIGSKQYPKTEQI